MKILAISPLLLGRRGFSLVEIAMAALFMAVLLIGLLELTSSSSRTSMDAYYEFLASQIAREPIEIFRGFGYHWGATYKDHVPKDPYDFRLGQWVDMQELVKKFPEYYPQGVAYFERLVETEIVKQTFPRALKVRVSLRPAGKSPLKIWLTRDYICQEAIIYEQPYEFSEK